MKPDLCLGTAQFGMSYGITNSLGKIDILEIKSILNTAQKEGIRLLDTAQAYGDAESILGELTKQKDHFKIISKISVNKNIPSTKNIYNYLDDSLDKTLNKLRCNKLEAILLHDASIFDTPMGLSIIKWLISIKAQNKVNKIGVSIYNKNELTKLNLDTIDIIQLPLSIYDQRMINDGTLKKLKSHGISIHARSIFLQGLILQMPQKWPKTLSNQFKTHHEEFFKAASFDSTQILKRTLEFVMSLPEVEAILIGVTSQLELTRIIRQWKEIKRHEGNSQETYKKWSWSTVSDLDPRLWPKNI